MRCYTCRKYDDCELPWKCDGTMYDCTAYELEQTNEEWIKQANTEQLAEILVCMAEDKSEAKAVHKENVRKCVCWLKQPHTFE